LTQRFNNSTLKLVKNSWWKYLFVLLLPITLIAVFFWRRNHLQPTTDIDQSLNDLASSDYLDFKLNNFPLEPGGELGIFYRLDCSFDELIIFRNYQQLPSLPGNWRSLAELSCQYLNANQQLETIYLPLYLYQPSTQRILFVGADIKLAEEAEVRETIEMAGLGFYQAMIENALGANPEKGAKLKIEANYPEERFSNNETRGVAFETLLEANPPYTQEDLINFYQTGEAKYLLQIDNKKYFWPVVGYSF